MYKINGLGSFETLPPEVISVLNSDFDDLQYRIEKRRFNVNKRIAISSFNFTLLQIALRIKNMQMVNWLIEKGAILNDQYDPAIFTAVQFTDMEFTQKIIDNGGLCNLSKKQPGEIFSYMHYGENYSMIDLLEENGVTVSKYGGSFFRQLFLGKDINMELLTKIYSMGVDINYNCPDAIFLVPITPLMVAIRHKHAQAAMWLLDQNANVMMIGDDGDRAYTIAVENELTEVAARIKSLEPQEWHDEQNKISELRRLECPRELLDFLRNSALLMTFSEDCPIAYIRFFSLTDTVVTKWKRKNIVLLSVEVASYGSVRFVWMPKEKKVCAIDMEHDELFPLAPWNDFFKNAEILIETKIFER
ncbi:ankyrin repeat domain-containing protein [Paenibacillus macquariensis]|uniref:Ankyrin repeat-containing protein n=2 Tax=Paenibacillus macquariensis TaxID=948756 RepID=A0ABY1JV95_9BACL|nr:ankyrin repeat domain-containing protein [Paenibacillus macquariensis]MEC0090825.1 ankyrin repeat domain-containing protein [Paenibacillus macquariensis]OAB34564.1 hypothetical protein PMSM_11925 [Paenibacillus macquariensis subsp. macquariensis]SIQ82781.1 hypothetical protein SAMN05421578_104240 [Paenibacillus macquariensis]